MAFLLITTSSIWAQNEEKNEERDYSNNVNTIDNTVKSLYASISGEKGEDRDWDLFKHLFYPNAKLIPSGKNTDREPQVTFLKPNDYIKSSGQWLVDNGFFEKEIHRTINAFGNIAHVFSTYESYYSLEDKKPFMRGINSIQLFHDGDRWWIVNVYWSQETPIHPIPNKYLPK